MSRPEIRLEPQSVVIADLHLDVGPSGGAHEDFVSFTRRIAGAPTLVVLGDLFDARVGPAQMELESARVVLDALAELERRGTKLEILVGNRDFLLERRFEARTRARVHANGFVGLVGDERVLFVHGDELCTLDHKYQRLKRVLRSRPISWTAPRLPRAVSLWSARRLRKASVQAVASKPSAEKAQQASEALRLARSANCTTIVVGHAHEFRDEQLDGVRWIVLDAFGGERDVLSLASSGAPLRFASSRSEKSAMT